MPEMTSLYKTEAGEREVMALYDTMLEHWPVPYETQHIATRHGETFVIASGSPSAPPLLLLHGAASNALAWMGEVASLSARCRVYAVDIPGDPGRSAPARMPMQGPAYAEWLTDVLDGLGIAQLSLAGISQGGWTALKFAAQCPERVRRLVLLAPGGIAPVRTSFLLRAIVLSMFGRRGAEAITRITFGDQPIAPEAVTYMNTIMTHFRPRIEAQPIFSEAELKRLSMPVLLIVGGRDALLPSLKTTARLRACVPHVVVHMLPEAGHVLHGVARGMAAFVSGQS